VSKVGTGHLTTRDSSIVGWTYLERAQAALKLEPSPVDVKQLQLRIAATRRFVRDARKRTCLGGDEKATGGGGGVGARYGKSAVGGSESGKRLSE